MKAFIRKTVFCRSSNSFYKHNNLKSSPSIFVRSFTQNNSTKNSDSKISETTANLKIDPIKVHDCEGPSHKIEVKKSELLTYYRDIMRIRRMEIASDIAYKRGLIRGFCHLYDGQEAIAVGLEAGIKPNDHIITAYRCHAQQLLRGDNMKSIMSELMGKAQGSSKGKGGSMHLYLPEKNFQGGNGIVGAQVPVGAGIAFACKYLENNSICVAMYGDGAANQGQIYESANMAALQKLPLIFLCENNQYGMGTSVHRAAFQPEFYLRGAYIPGIQCDGMDVLSCRATMEYAADQCRSGKGPIFVEMKTYRYHGHSMSDPGKTYRTTDEVQSYRQNRDSALRVRKLLLELGWSDEAELKKIDREARSEADEASKYASQEAGDPDLETRFADIYCSKLGESNLKYIRSPDRFNSYGKNADSI